MLYRKMCPPGGSDPAAFSLHLHDRLLNCFDLPVICALNYQYNVMFKTTQLVHSNLFISSVFTFSMNYVDYHSMNLCVYGDIIV